MAECIMEFSDGTDNNAFTDAEFKKVMLGRDNGPNSPGCGAFDHTFQIVAVRQAGGGKVLMGTVAFQETDITTLGITSGDIIRPIGSTTNLPANDGYELTTQVSTCAGLAIHDIIAVV